MSAPAVPGGPVPSEAARAERLEKLLWIGVAAAVAVVVGTAAVRLQANPILAMFAIGLVFLAWHKTLLSWQTLLACVLVVIVFVPIRRYTVAGGLPFALEPYRLLIAVVLMAWLLALLVDGEVRWRNTRFEAPVLGFAAAILGSLALNIGRITGEGITSEVVKKVSFFASFLLVMYFVSSVVRNRKQVDRVLVVLVGGSTFVALCAILESRTGLNPFNSLHRAVPLLHLDPEAAAAPPGRGGRARAYASAQHPIALGAALVLLLPLAVYLYRRSRQPLWMAAAAILAMGSLSTGSRTAAAMLAAELVAFFVIKRKETVRLLPMLVPLIIVCQVAMPGTLGTFKAILFPEGGLIAEQQGGGGGTGAGRIADLGPSLAEWSRNPLLGQGFGTRLTSGSDKLVNARILDNQWLGTLLEIGALGTLALLWLYVRAVRMLARLAKTDDSPHGWLLAGLACGLAAFGIGMFTFDAFSFIQVTFMTFILLGLAAVAVRLGPDQSVRWLAPAPSLPERETARV